MSSGRGFISYSHADSEFVDALALALTKDGVDVFFDKWDIQPGDSLVDRIFNSGLANARLFIVVVSKDSVDSKWVREELDHATVKRIESKCRVVPVRLGNVAMPAVLETLLYIKGEEGVESVARQIANLYHGIHERPEVASPPPRAVAAKAAAAIPGLSKLAAMVGGWLLTEHSKFEDDDNYWFDGPEIAAALALQPVEVNDAIAELQGQRYVQDITPLGTAPYDFGQVQPTAWFYYKAGQLLSYNPDGDIKAVCRIAAAEDGAVGSTLQEKTGIPPARLNRAVELIKANQLAQVIETMGTHPYSFNSVVPTFKTRQVARDGV